MTHVRNMGSHRLTGNRTRIIIISGIEKHKVVGCSVQKLK
jgi:hypothetical protein